LCCLYIKPRIKAVSPENDELFEQLTYFINKYSQDGKIIVMGDFNSRTARLPDYIELDGNLLNAVTQSSLEPVSRLNVPGKIS
jgi:endonuclease/exonuclease/phosphatase (EEP) superfamily protein YafD